jgi:hypothetical protein
MISMPLWMAAFCLGGFMYAVFSLLRRGLPLLEPVAVYLFVESYHRKQSAHRKTRRPRVYKTAEMQDLADDNIRVPENWASDVKEQVREATWSEITANYDREILATYERTNSGQLRELPFNTSEMPAITSDVPPTSNVRVYWGSQETVPDVYGQLPPYPTDTEADPFAYDGSRWAPTQVLEPVG